MSVAKAVIGGGYETYAYSNAEQYLVLSDRSVREAFSVITDGVASLTLALSLPRNAVVKAFDVVVHAERADAALLANAARLRPPVVNAGQVTVVADFGTLRTVSDIGVAFNSSAAIEIKSVTAWTGTQFAPFPIYDSGTNSDFKEVRTERLKITLTGSSDVTTIGQNVWLALPDPPADLEIRINNGPPVWSSPGPVQAGIGGWDTDANQTASLGPALAQLTGDPTDNTETTYQIVLTSRVPGRLSLTKGTTAISYIGEVDLGAEKQRELTFDSEGAQAVPLTLPSVLNNINTIEQVSFVIAGTLPAERVVPPVGPPIATILGGANSAAGVAEMVLDVDHAACVRLPRNSGLVELTGIRLPLRAGKGGAEVRVVLLQNLSSSSAEEEAPGPPVDGATSKPVQLDEAQPSAGDAWTTFPLPRPLAIAADKPPWAAVVVGRGTVRWSLGQFEDASKSNAVRRGLPQGPWQVLPKLIDPATATVTIGGRVRIVGHADRAKPFAPLSLKVEGASGGDIPVTPTAKGTQVTWPGPSAPAAPIAPSSTDSSTGGLGITLLLTSYLVGTVTLRNVLMTATRL